MGKEKWHKIKFEKYTKNDSIELRKQNKKQKTKKEQTNKETNKQTKDKMKIKF